MSADHSASGLPRKSRNWRFIASVVVIALVLIAFLAYATYQNSQCGFVGCVPIDVPVVLSVSVTQYTPALAPSNCGIVTQGYPQAVVCLVEPFPGTSATITLNMTSQNGNSQVAFGLFSSSQYIQFKSTYPCQYTTNQPDYNTLRCPVSGSGSTYRFNYTASQNLSSQIEAVLTIVVTKTCCWP